MANYVIRRWYDIGLMLAALAIVWLMVGDLGRVQLILVLNFVVLVLHQFEEMRWPGGSPWILNEVFNRRDGPADRYPLNQANCAFINITAWAFYLVPVILPGAVWLGIAQVLFGMVGQLIVHGVVINIRLKTIYNPGLAAVVLGHVPLGIWYLVEVNGQGLVNGWDWLFGVLMLAAFVGGIMLRLGYGLMSDKNTRYPLNHGKRRGGTGSSISRALASPPCRLVPAPARGRCQLSFPKAAGRRHLLVADCGTAERLV